MKYAISTRYGWLGKANQVGNQLMVVLNIPDRDARILFNEYDIEKGFVKRMKALHPDKKPKLVRVP